MLFNSYAFLFGFFPLVFAGFFLLARRSHLYAAGWLGLASLFFYGYWSLKAVPLLVASICVNYYLGKLLTPMVAARDKLRKPVLYLALAFNLGLLGFFKYANFFIGSANEVLAAFSSGKIEALNIVLPIGISFFTFTQIAFLVDCYQNKVKERNFVHYLLFVTYFPHLIAGPVLHHGQIMPQFAMPQTYRIDGRQIAIGMTIFTIGLAKKLLIADSLGVYADLLFKNAGDGLVPAFFMSWFGTLAFTLQIYFDFSGYSDMAIGMSLFFGIVLPVNFYSPYRATSIVDFWRRWHISLSTFLRDYLYFPLGGNRLGKFRRHINLMITMVLGGLWHGANWTFALWGAMHGMYLVINHAWRALGAGRSTRKATAVRKTLSWALTFLCVVLSWVLFKADSLTTAISIYKGMLGMNGFSLPASIAQQFNELSTFGNIRFSGIWQGAGGGSLYEFVGLVIVALLLVLAFPPAADLLTRLQSADCGRHETGAWKFSYGFAVGVLFMACVISMYHHASQEFLYFQF